MSAVILLLSLYNLYKLRRSVERIEKNIEISKQYNSENITHYEKVGTFKEQTKNAFKETDITGMLEK